MKLNSQHSRSIPGTFISILYVLSVSTLHPLAVAADVSDVDDLTAANDIGPPNFVKRAAPSTDANKKWPKNTVYYEIDDELSSVKKLIKMAMQTIQKVSCIRYVERTNQIDYVRFQHNTTRCLEPVGRQGGAQNIYINLPDCGNLGFFIHASMQVLGFYHEHQRADRDNYITVFPENIEPEWMTPFTKLGASTHYQNSAYDVDSIMHYGSFQFSKNGKPTILTKAGDLTQSWEEKAKLSKLDIVAINEYYNCRHHRP